MKTVVIVVLLALLVWQRSIIIHERFERMLAEAHADRCETFGPQYPEEVRR